MLLLWEYVTGLLSYRLFLLFVHITVENKYSSLALGIPVNKFLAKPMPRTSLYNSTNYNVPAHAENLLRQNLQALPNRTPSQTQKQMVAPSYTCFHINLQTLAETSSTVL